MEKDKNISTSTSDFYEEYLDNHPNKKDDEKEPNSQPTGVGEDREMAGKGFYVTVQYKTLPEKTTVAFNEIKELLSKVREEPGYIKVALHVDREDPTHILLIEQWEDEAYYKGDHMNTAHLQRFINSSRSFLTGPPKITFWESID